MKKNLKKPFGLVAVGNALIDVLAYTDEEFIAAQEARGMKKGAMILIDKPRAAELSGQITTAREMSGGSVANTLCGFASFGGTGAFIGKVADDEAGKTFRADMLAQGITYQTPSLPGSAETGRSYILVTPDGERTQNTFLGDANEAFCEDDIDIKLVQAAQIVLLEGYLYDKPGAQAAFAKAGKAAAAAGTKVAFTLSDAECVKRHHANFEKLVKRHVDILFANQREIKALTGKDDFNEAVAAIQPYCETVVLTQGAKGATIIHKGQSYKIPPAAKEKLVDTTGAGDAFAAGVLYGLSQNMDPVTCGTLGAKAAAKTISHIGARSPGVKFSDFLPR